MTGFGSLERNWSVVAAPTPSWAGTVFPDAAETEAIELLWDSILRACRVDSGDPVSAWRDHVASLRSRREYLTSRQYTGLRYEAPGTDLWLGLPDNSRWEGGSVSSPEGREFCPNIPTEEVFVSPHLAKAEGTVKSTKPLSLYGNLIEDFALELSGGRIVGATARVGQEVLDQLLQTDEGSVRFGEAAMVPMSSAVAAEELVWNNTLFDENDGCHIAIGRSYPTTVEGGTAMDPQTQKAAGLNSSTVHVDFVVGSPELSVFGIRDDGSEEPILTDGEWGFET